MGVGSRQEAVSYLTSLASTGHKQEALEIGRYITRRWPRSAVQVASALAEAAPEEVFGVLGKKTPVLAAAATWKCGDISKTERLLAGVKRCGVNAGLIAANVAQARGDTARASHLINEILIKDDLEPVTLDHDASWISRFRCDANTSIQGGPLVSVVMSVRNVERFISAAVRSILNQTWKNLELIIVNDGSTDATEEKALEAAAGDKRCRLLRFPVGRGAYIARNSGLSCATGRFITFHDGDDWSHPRKIELQIQALLHDPSLMAVSSCWARIDEKGYFWARQTYPLRRLNPSSLMFYREKVIDHLGYFDCVVSGADTEYRERLKVFYGNQAVGCVRKLLSFGSHRSRSLMTDSSTGIGASGYSRDRIAYWESWRRWHAELFEKKDSPRLQQNAKQRRFPVPKGMAVDPFCI
ncbi:MAG: glycosyltransferase family 2 protein [Myxococcota bacterium]|nr:glycosyltransferase family 2 protein [Myxococcota bacterium]